MLRIDASSLREQVEELNDLEREQLPFATALALTRTAESVEEFLVGQMRTRFDRPTPYTLNSLRVFPATKTKLVARVWMKDEAVKAAPATKWLSPEIYGGQRNDKRAEVMLRAKGILPDGKFVVPGKGAKLDRYGNISRGQLTQALSGVGGFTEQGYDANATGSARSRRKGNARRYFVMFDGDRKPLGIAERTGNGRDKLSILLAFVARPSYRKAFPFHELAEQHAEAQLPGQFRAAIAEAMRTRRR